MKKKLSGVELDVALSALRKSAKSIEDIQVWFSDRTYLLIGDVNTPTEAKVDLKMSVDVPKENRITKSANILSWVSKHRDFRLLAKTTLRYMFPSRAWSTDGEGEEADRTACLTDNQVLYLRLELWPFATAMTTAEYFSHDVYKNPTKWDFAEDLIQLLNETIPRHFPGMSLDLIASMLESDVFEVDLDNCFYHRQVFSILFATKDESISVDLPHDLLAE